MRCWIIVTTNESQNEFSELTKFNVSKLQQLGIKLFQKTDATKIHNDYAENLWKDFMKE